MLYQRGLQFSGIRKHRETCLIIDHSYTGQDLIISSCFLSNDYLSEFIAKISSEY